MRDLVTHFKPESMGAEAFRALRTNLQFLRLETKGKIFLITSSFVQEGKTLNIVNLALTMAQAGNKVLLIDADLRKPMVHKVFGLTETPGITDYVLGNYQAKEICNTISDVMLGEFGIDNILKNPGMDNLHIVTAGTRLGVDYAHTVSCYRPDALGAACGTCDACVLRRDGFAAAGLADPTRYA